MQRHGQIKTSRRCEYHSLAYKCQNLVNIVGVAMKRRPWLAVLEFMQYGDLGAALQTTKERRFMLFPTEYLKLCTQICAGMEFIAAHVCVLRHAFLAHGFSVLFTWTSRPEMFCCIRVKVYLSYHLEFVKIQSSK